MERHHRAGEGSEYDHHSQCHRSRQQGVDDIFTMLIKAAQDQGSTDLLTKGSMLDTNVSDTPDTLIHPWFQQGSQEIDEQAVREDLLKLRNKKQEALQTV